MLAFAAGGEAAAVEVHYLERTLTLTPTLTPTLTLALALTLTLNLPLTPTLTLTRCTISTAVALVAPDTSRVLHLLSALCGFPLMYVFPTLMLLRSGHGMGR